MSALLAALLIAALLCFVAWLLSGPFRQRARSAPVAQSDERRGLESARDAKYGEIRDNETDYRTGKLSEEDYRTLDRALRAEAVEILRAIDELEARAAGASD